MKFKLHEKIYLRKKLLSFLREKHCSFPHICLLLAGAFPVLAQNNTVNENSSVAFGEDNEVTGSFSQAMGKDHEVTGRFSSAFGLRNDVSGIASFSVGYLNEISSFSFASGRNNLSSNASYSFLSGQDNSTTGRDYSILMGEGNSLVPAGVGSSSGILVGYENWLEAESGYSNRFSILLGEYNSSSVNSWIIGRANKGVKDAVVLGKYNSNLIEDASLIVGTGAGPRRADRRNGMIVFDNGDVVIPKRQGDISMGVFSSSLGEVEPMSIVSSARISFNNNPAQTIVSGDLEDGHEVDYTFNVSGVNFNFDGPGEVEVDDGIMVRIGEFDNGRLRIVNNVVPGEDLFLDDSGVNTAGGLIVLPNGEYLTILGFRKSGPYWYIVTRIEL